MADEDYGQGGPREGYDAAAQERKEAEQAIADASAAKAAKVFPVFEITEALKAKYPALRGNVGDPLRHLDDLSFLSRSDAEDEKERQEMAKGGKKLPAHKKAQRSAYYEAARAAKEAEALDAVERKGRSVAEKVLILSVVNYCKHLKALSKEEAIKEVGADEYYRVLRYGNGTVLEATDVSLSLVMRLGERFWVLTPIPSRPHPPPSAPI
jgi:hypothetical protein